VYLTSLGWDRGLVVALHTKLAAEMADTAIVVANSFGMWPTLSPDSKAK